MRISRRTRRLLVARYGFVPTVSSIADYWTWMGNRTVWQRCYDWMPEAFGRKRP